MHFDGVAFLVGKFDPPTKFNYNTAKFLESRDYVTDVCVIIGNEGDYTDTDQRYKLWETYIKSDYSHKIRLEVSNKSGLTAVREKLKKNPTLKCYIGLDENTARSPEMEKYFGDFPNYMPEIVSSNFEKESRSMIKTILEGNKDSFYEFLPDTLSDENKEICWSILRNTDLNEELASRIWWKDIIDKNIVNE